MRVAGPLHPLDERLVQVGQVRARDACRLVQVGDAARLDAPAVSWRRYISTSAGTGRPRARRSSASDLAIQTRTASKNAMSSRWPVISCGGAQGVEPGQAAAANRKRSPSVSSPSAGWLPGVAGSRR